MLYMKEDDMDEMLRKAADNYEVDADKAADWDAVYAATHEADAATPITEKKRKRLFAFWWLLLIPLGWIAHTEYNKFNHQYSENKNTQASIKTKNNPNSTIVSSENISANNNTIKKDLNDNNNAVHHQQLIIVHHNSQKKNNNNLSENNFSMQQQSPGLIHSQDKTTIFPATAPDTKNKTENLLPPSFANSQTNNSSVINDNKISQTNTASSTAKLSAQKNKNNGHYFYAGLIAGADLSFVKYQQIQPIGYNVGLLVGYKFNKLSIESGLFLAKKNYYTDGEYFDKSEIPYFNNAEVLSVDGYCSMYEIPLNIKYDFSTKKKHTWFATAGLSSYLMKKEFYNYAYQKDGQNHYGSYPYYNTTQNWFSVANLSAGYQLQTGAKTNLRAETYFKATLSGVGTGSLPISSAGINLGIIRKIP